MLDDRSASTPARESGGDHRLPQVPERTGDVHALAAWQGERVARAMTPSRLKVRHAERAVERGVEGDGEDHVNTDLIPSNAAIR